MPISSGLFHVITGAGPECAWEILTPRGGRAGYLYGLRVETDWLPGSPIVLRGPSEGPRVWGTVLFADRPRRLSFSLASSAEQPSCHVTWEICPGDAGTVVRLFVDEVDEAETSPEELEAVWLPILSRLRADLERAERGAGR